MSIRYHVGPIWAFWLGNSTPGTDCGVGVVSISRGPLNVRQFVLLVQREFKNLTAYIPTAVHQNFLESLTSSFLECSSLVLMPVLTRTSRVLKCSEGDSGPTAPLAMRPIGRKSVPNKRRRTIALERNGAEPLYARCRAVAGCCSVVVSNQSESVAQSAHDAQKCRVKLQSVGRP